MELKPVAVTPRVSSTIDFLRWSSALLVLLFHVRINVVHDDALRTAGIGGEIVRALTSAGPAAVMCFFVLSGYLVGGTVVNRTLRGTFSLRGYALDRATRIYVVLIPALALGLAFDATRIAWLGAAPFDWAPAYAPLTILGNLLFLQEMLVPTAGSNLPLWSLSNEGWYYLLFPLLFLSARPGGTMRTRLAYGAIGLALLAVAAVLHFKLVMMFAAWLMGVAVRYLPRPAVRSWAVAWAILVVAIFSNHLLYGHLRAHYLLPAIAAANLLLTATHAAPDCQPASARRNELLASFSFSLYLTHSWVLHLMLGAISRRPKLALDLQPSLAAAGIVVALMATLIVFAWLFAQATEYRTAAVRAWVATLSRRRSRTAAQ